MKDEVSLKLRLDTSEFDGDVERVREGLERLTQAKGHLDVFALGVLLGVLLAVFVVLSVGR